MRRTVFASMVLSKACSEIALDGLLPALRLSNIETDHYARASGGFHGQTSSYCLDRIRFRGFGEIFRAGVRFEARGTRAARDLSVRWDGESRASQGRGRRETRCLSFRHVGG